MHVLKLVIKQITDNELEIKKEPSSDSENAKHDNTVDEELKGYDVEDQLKEHDGDVEPETEEEHEGKDK